MQDIVFNKELEPLNTYFLQKHDAYRDLILTDLIIFLNNQRICYAIKELFENPSEVQKLRSIDVFIDLEDYKKVTSSISSIFNEHEIITILRVSYRNTATQITLAYQISGEPKLYQIKVNIYSDYKIHGKLLFSSKELLPNRVYSIKEGYWTLDNTYRFLHLLIKAIKHRQIELAQFLELCNCWETSKTKIALHLERLFNEGTYKMLLECLNGRNKNDLNRNLEFLAKNSKINPLYSFRNLITKTLDLTKSFLKPPGLVVGILGRDGSGKSTFINEITKSLGDCFNNTTIFKRHPKVFYKGLIFKKGADYHFSKPHLYKERSYIASFIKLNLLLIEFLAGYWLKVFPYKRKAYLVFYDRYFIDVLSDPLRYRIKGNKSFIRMIHYILPQPDIWIILDLSSEVLMRRKQELTFEMSEKLRQEYLNLQKILPNCVVINNEDEMHKTVNNATAHILSYMQRRMLKAC